MNVASLVALLCPLLFAQNSNPKSLGIEWALDRVSYEYYWHGEMGTFEAGRHTVIRLNGDVKAYIPSKDSTQQAPWVVFCLGETARCILIQREAPVSTIHSVSSVSNRNRAIRHLLDKSDALGVYNPDNIESTIGKLQEFTIHSIQTKIPDYKVIANSRLTSEALIRTISSEVSCKTADKSCDRTLVIPKQISTSLVLPVYLSCSCHDGDQMEFVFWAALLGDRIFVSATSGVRDPKLKLRYKQKIEAIADHIVKDRQ